MSNQSDREKNMRLRLERLSTEEHESMYVRFLSALFINEDGGHTEQAAFTRKQIEGLLAFGKIPFSRQVELKKQVRKSTRASLALVQDILWSARLGVPLKLSEE